MNGRLHLPAGITAATPVTSFTPARPGILQRKCACGGTPGPSGECAACRSKRLARQHSSSSRANAADFSTVKEALRSPGQPLDSATRADMEPRFGHDFSAVRVHTTVKAAESARAVNALAYTVGQDVVFGAGRYAPQSSSGRLLLAHELTHVVQQSGTLSNPKALTIADEHDPVEREAKRVAQAILSGDRPVVALRSAGGMLQRAKGDMVGYTGGQTGALVVLQAGKRIYMAPAVSGHPGHGENEPSEGPIPSGTYTMHPGIKQPTVSKAQSGVCGAAGIGTGYQEITSTDATPCSGAHYCNVPCPTAANPTQMCFTPQDCWGRMRIKIEGSKAVVTPAGKKVTRDGFYIHGGNPTDAVSSGCIKSLDDGVFAAVRKLTGVQGAVPMCVGSACAPSINTVVQKAAIEAVQGAVESVSESIRGMVGL